MPMIKYPSHKIHGLCDLYLQVQYETKNGDSAKVYPPSTLQKMSSIQFRDGTDGCIPQIFSNCQGSHKNQKEE